VEVNEEDFRAAMRQLLADVKFPVRFGAARSPFRVVPVASVSLDPFQLALARDYRAWCERRHKPSDCLDLLRDRPVLTPEGRYKLAFDFALGAEWDGFAGELRGMADPAVVKVRSPLFEAVHGHRGSRHSSAGRVSACSQWRTRCGCAGTEDHIPTSTIRSYTTSWSVPSQGAARHRSAEKRC
jgi:hypothetical protein